MKYSELSEFDIEIVLVVNKTPRITLCQIIQRHKKMFPNSLGGDYKKSVNKLTKGYVLFDENFLRVRKTKELLTEDEEKVIQKIKENPSLTERLFRRKFYNFSYEWLSLKDELIKKGVIEERWFYRISFYHIELVQDIVERKSKNG